MECHCSSSGSSEASEHDQHPLLHAQPPALKDLFSWNHIKRMCYALKWESIVREGKTPVDFIPVKSLFFLRFWLHQNFKSVPGPCCCQPRVSGTGKLFSTWSGRLLRGTPWVSGQGRCEFVAPNVDHSGLFLNRVLCSSLVFILNIMAAFDVGGTEGS